MKRVLSLVLALALVLGSIPAGFAADTQSAGEILKGYGVLSGDANGNLNDTQTIDRATMYTVLIKLLGKDAEAKAYTVPSTFSDDDTNWAANYIAFAEKEGLTKGIGNGLFSPNGKVTLQQMATIMLRALGYEADYNTAIADATAKGLLKGVVESENAGLVVKSDVYSSMLNTLNAPVKDSTELLGNKLKIVGFNAGSELKVASITAGTAKSFLVKFNRAVAETDKVTFAVKRATTAMALTTTWNADKTEATLASTANLPEATYSVSVLADAKEVSAKDIAITAQKLSKIEIVSDKLSVVTSGSTTKGYATYKAYDQYGNDVTTSYLTNNITWTTGVGTLDGITTKGVLELKNSSQNLLIYSTVVITGLDTTAGITATKSLATTTALGTLSDFKFGDATNVKLVDNDTTSVFYIPYTALDMSGNETKNYELVRQGLLDSDNKNSTTVVDNTTNITVSNNKVSVTVVKDPANNKNAAIEVKVTGNNDNIIDLPLTITAMTLTGKVSTVNTTLAKSKQMDTFTLMAPTTNISSLEKVEVPYEAYDQAGTKLTKWADVNDKVTLTPAGSTTTTGLYFEKRADGTAKLMFKAPSISGTQSTSTYVTAVVKSSTTGKMSSLSLTTQEGIKANEVQFSTSSFVTAMENGATQKVDFWDKANVKVLDQYGRDADFYRTTKNLDYKLYRVVVSSDSSSLTVAFPNLRTDAQSQALITANNAAGGSATLTLTLEQYQTATENPTTHVVTYAPLATPVAIDSQAVSISIVKTDDIKGYTVDAGTAPIYTTLETAGATITDANTEYNTELDVYGKTSGGAKVILAGTPVVNVSVDNTTDFVATLDTPSTANAYDCSLVYAVKPADKAKTSATTNATVTIFHKNEVNTVTAPLTSSTVLPKATDIGIKVDQYFGATLDGDEITIDTNLIDLNGLMLQKYDKLGSKVGRSTHAYLYVLDSYGTKGMNFTSFKVTGTSVDTNNVANVTVSIDDEGNLSLSGFTSGEWFTISAVTNNGLVKTIKFIAK